MNRKRLFGMIFGIAAAVSVMISCKNMIFRDSETANTFLRKSDVSYVCASDNISAA